MNARVLSPTTLAIAAAIVSLPLLGVRAAPDEPTAEGRPLSAWLEELRRPDGGVRMAAARAIGTMGSAAASATIPLLEAANGLPDLRDRTIFIDTVRNMGEPAIPELAKAVRHADHNVRLAATSTLHYLDAKLGIVAGNAAVVAALADASPDVRTTAASSFAGIPAERRAMETRRALAAACDAEKEPRVRAAILGVLAVAEPLPEELAAQKAALADADDDVGLAAVRALIAGGAAGAGVVQDAIVAGDARVREKLVAAIPQASDKTAAALAPWIEHANGAVRLAATLGFVERRDGPPKETLVAILIATLESRDAEERASAIDALEKLRAVALKPLRAAFDEGKKTTKIGAALVLLGYKDADQPPGLLELLEAELKTIAPEDRLAVASRLVRRGRRSKAVIEEVLHALQKGDAKARLRAASTLDGLDALPDSAIKAIVKATKDEDAEVRDAALTAYSRLRPARAAAEQVAVYAALLGHASAKTRARAIALIGTTNEPEPVAKQLVKALDDADPAVAAAAARVLGQIEPDAKIGTALVKVLAGHANEDVRAAAAGSLGTERAQAQRTPAAPLAGVIPTLANACGDPSPKVRTAAVRALGSLGVHAAPALPTLERLAKDDADPGVRAAAETAMPKIKAK